MKKILLLATIASAISLNASAQTNEDSYVAQFAGRTDIPRPAKVVSPEIHSGDNGAVDLKFKVSAQGKVHDVQVVNSNGTVDASAVVDAVLAWKFLPKNGQSSDVDCTVRVNVSS